MTSILSPWEPLGSVCCLLSGERHLSSTWRTAVSLNLPWISLLMLSVGVAEARNLTTLANTEADPLCEQDVSALPLFPIRGIFTQPEGLRERALQPLSLIHI